MIDEEAYQAATDLRKEIKAVAEKVYFLRKLTYHTPEAVANATLAYRHLEDASMRLGKVLQALDGGVSVYDKTQVVGA